jgi:hypothetical protein
VHKQQLLEDQMVVVSAREAIQGTGMWGLGLWSLNKYRKVKITPEDLSQVKKTS